jgi:hypothetical protein
MYILSKVAFSNPSTFLIEALPETAEIAIDTLYPFDFATPRFFQVPIIGGSEPNLKFSVARIAQENATNEGPAACASRIY